MVESAAATAVAAGRRRGSPFYHQAIPPPIPFPGKHFSHGSMIDDVEEDSCK